MNLKIGGSKVGKIMFDGKEYGNSKLESGTVICLKSSHSDGALIFKNAQLNRLRPRIRISALQSGYLYTNDIYNLEDIVGNKVQVRDGANHYADISFEIIDNHLTGTFKNTSHADLYIAITTED